MDERGRLRVQRAIAENGREFSSGPEYERSLSLDTLKLEIPPESRVVWYSNDTVEGGSFSFNPHAEDKVIRVCQAYGNPFEAYTLAKVNNEKDSDKRFLITPGRNGDKDNDGQFFATEEFYPVLHRMLAENGDWGDSFLFSGRAQFEFGVYDWTNSVLGEFKSTLQAIGIYGAVAVSRYPYAWRPDVWRAFCELWGPLTNTFHHANGEMGISLYDLKVIGGLPILGNQQYEEFIPPNRDLIDGTCPSTVAELLRIHSQLSIYYTQPDIYWHQWMAHFYRGDVSFQVVENEPSTTRKKRLQHPKIQLRASREGRFAAFLAFWLSRFVLPSRNRRVRPESFYMACQMARGVRVSLAPTALGHIYHGLGDMARHPEGPGLSDACLPCHYIIGWLGEHFPELYTPQREKSFVADLPHLIRYAGIIPNEVSITRARILFRSEKHVIYRPTPFIEHDGRVLVDDGKLSDELFELLICIRSSVLPVRVGGDLWLEPYYPNRFARQFGFDQGVPSNKLSFSLDRRRHCGVEALAIARMKLFRNNTTACFYVPRSHHMGCLTRWYCRWWMGSCQPYIGLSVSRIYAAVNKSRAQRENIYVVRPLDNNQPPPDEPHYNNSRPTKTANKVGAPPPSRKRSSSHVDSKTSNKRGHRDRVIDLDVDDAAIPVDDTSPVDIPSDDVCMENMSHDAEIPFDQADHTTSHFDEYGSNFGSFERGISDHDVFEDFAGSDQLTSNAVCILPQAKHLPPMPSLGDFVYELLGNNVDEHRRTYISDEVQGIVKKLSSFRTPGDLHLRRAEIIVALTLLSGMVSALRLSQDLFKKFEGHISLILDLSAMYSEYAAIVEEEAQLDIDFINALAEQHGKCCATIGTLDLELNDIVVKLANINATEVDVVTAENMAQAALQHAKDMRREFESNRALLSERRNVVEASLMQKRQLELEFRQARQDAGEHRLPHIKEARAACAILQSKIHGLIDTLSGPKN